MPRKSAAITELSPRAQAEMCRLGDDIRSAIKVRDTLSDFAARIGVTRPTLGKLLNGDPTVSTGVLISALDALGLLDHLGPVAAPENDPLGQSLRLQGKRPDLGDNMDRDF